ncbi:hypothetical protein [Paenibacillus sp. FSL R7-0333]|uniref:hypothetical protein n=1 Tax=Paenibacillus sp. FSL R7-0333 TaxID=1926587 RepID=UPI0011812AF0
MAVGDAGSCKRCGSIFIANSPNQLYCSDCTEEVVKGYFHPQRRMKNTPRELRRTIQRWQEANNIVSPRSAPPPQGYNVTDEDIQQIGIFSSPITAKKRLISIAKREHFVEITQGEFDSICAYSLCLNPINSENGRRYCCDTCKTNAYRERIVAKAKVELCPQCRQPWTEPKANKKGKKPNHCAECQAYFKTRYEQKKSPLTS